MKIYTCWSNRREVKYCDEHYDAVSGDYYDEIDIKILISEYKRACLEVATIKNERKNLKLGGHGRFDCRT